MPLCTPDNPMSDDALDEQWSHRDWETVYEGVYFHIVQCVVCGFECRIEPPDPDEKEQ